MNFEEFKQRTGAGDEALARAAWDQVIALIKAALPAESAAIDRALEPEPVNKNASDSGHAAEGTE